MQKIKRRIFSGAVCEYEVLHISDRIKKLKDAEVHPRFRTDEERERHKVLMSRRHHARIINATFSPTSKYSTLTVDDEHEIHTFTEARHLRDLYFRRLKYAAPDAKITIYMGRGKTTARIHFHLLSDGINEETIIEKWGYGSIIQIVPLRAHNYYGGVDHGQDYTGLANYLFDHWTPEQGGHHRWKQTRNVCRPEKETPTVIKRNYSMSSPPRPPKGYILVESKSTDYGYLYFKYVRIPESPRLRKKKPNHHQKC